MQTVTQHHYIVVYYFSCINGLSMCVCLMQGAYGQPAYGQQQYGHPGCG